MLHVSLQPHAPCNVYHLFMYLVSLLGRGYFSTGKVPNPCIQTSSHWHPWARTMFLQSPHAGLLLFGEGTFGFVFKWCDVKDGDTIDLTDLIWPYWIPVIPLPAAPVISWHNKTKCRLKWQQLLQLCLLLLLHICTDTIIQGHIHKFMPINSHRCLYSHYHKVNYSWLRECRREEQTAQKWESIHLYKIIVLIVYPVFPVFCLNSQITGATGLYACGNTVHICVECSCVATTRQKLWHKLLHLARFNYVFVAFLKELSRN